MANEFVVKNGVITPSAQVTGSTSGSTTLVAAAAASGTLTLPAATDTLVGKATTDTLTNKTIAAASNTISGLTNTNLSGTAGITNANLANSSVTVGTTAISLGASSTTLTGLTSVTSTAFVGALTGNASSATTLQTGRTIALTGDVTYTSGSFNGSANVTGTAALASVGTAGTYTKVTTDAKGRVTSGATLVAADIPVLDASKITTGTIDAARLPSYVDDVIEGANLAAFPATGETGKIYVALDTNKTYRWSGSAYVYITSGAVDSVAGKTGVVTLVKADVGLGSVDNTADSAKNVLSASKLTTARTIGGVSFDGTSNINLPGVNAAGTQSTTGNAATATKWATGRTITLTGDVTGVSGSFDGSGNLSFATTIAANSVALGTDTTGNYVAGATAGTGIAITGTAGEGWSPTISLLASDLTLFPTSNFKKSVRVATTANITLSAPQTIDGIAVVAGNRVLVKNQTTASQNGIYVVAAGAWTRSVAADGSTEIDSAIVGIDEGTVNGGLFYTNTFKSTDVVGTTAMPWYKVTTELDNLTAGSTAIGTVTYSGTTNTAGQFNGGTTTPNGSTRLNYSGYFYPTFINLTGSGETATTATHYFVETGSDGFVRPKTLANVRTELVTTAAVNAAAATTLGTVTSGTWNATAITDTYLATISTAGKVSNSATTATNLNTASAIVARDASGNFSAGTITAALSGNASTATKWATGRTITLTGDVTGVSGSFDGSGNLSFATTIAANSVALGTDTTGNYVAGLTAGQGITITGTAGEGWSPTVALTALDLTLFPTSNYKKSVRVATTANITLSAPQTIDGIAVVAGNRVLVKNQTASAQNGIYVVAAGAWTRSVAADGSTEIDSAIVGVDEGTANGGKFFTNVFKSTDVVGTTAMPWYPVLYESGTWAIAISGNAGTATTLATARTIGMSGVTATATSFNGSANITIPVTAVPTTLLTGTIADARISGSYTGMTNLTGTGNVDFSRFLGNAADTALLPSLSWTTDPNTGIYSPGADQVGITTGGVSRLVVNTTSIVSTLPISASNLSGTNTGDQTTVSGNAGSATTLQTARTIGMSGVTATATSFNGSANITIPVTAVPTSLLTGTIADARISGSYTGMTNLTGSGTVDFAKFLGNAADTAALPSFSWTGDTNTGIYQPAADQLGFSTGGTSRLTLTTTAITSTLPITATSFSGSGTSLTALNATNLTSGTVPDARISGSYTGMTNLTGTGNVDFSRFLGNAADTALLPSLSWTTDPNTGIYSPGADQVGITTGGVSRLVVNTTSIASTLDITAPNLLPPTDNTGVVGNTAQTWNNGQFTNLTIDSTLTVRAAIDLADNDILRFGTGDDWEMYHNGTGNYMDLNVGDLLIRDDGTAGDPTRFTFGRTTGDLTASGSVAAPFLLNKNTIDTSYSIPAGYNAVAAGPVAINTDITVTIPDGSTWVIV